MFLVLVVHANFFSLGQPVYEKFSLIGFSQTFIQSLSSVCVNVFVMISGWFGIHPRRKGFFNFVFQILFFFCGIYAILVIGGLEPFSLKSVAQCFLLMPQNWFIKAYILLYFLSPVLNTYCKYAEVKTQRNVILLFFAFQTVFDTLTDGVDTFSGGYSTISFIGLYLLMQYIKRSNHPLLKMNSSSCFLIYIVISLITTLLYMIGSWYEISLTCVLYSYACPLVILSSLFLFLTFNSLHFESRFINWMASSAFAVYLLHTFPLILQNYYSPAIINIFAKWNGVEGGVLTCLFLIGIFIFAVMIDQIRKKLWNRVITILPQIND